MMLSIKTIILFILMLSLITIVHELGHFLAAKYFGVYCYEFSIGMGPILYSKQFKETKFSIRAFLIGGFVSMAGDDDNKYPNEVTVSIPNNRTLKGISRWKKFIIMFAGIFMNFVLSWLIYSMLLLNIGSYTIQSKPVINSIVENMPASKSTLQVGDIIEKVELDNGVVINPSDSNELSAFLSTYYDGVGSWKITVNRDGDKYVVEVLPEYSSQDDRYLIGVSFSNEAVNTVKVNFFNSFIYGFKYMFYIAKMTFASFIALFKGAGLNQLSGPIGVYKVVEEVSSYGFEYYIELLGLVSVNVAIFNALPLPIFDGGRAFLLLIEAIIRRPISKKIENIIFSASFAILVLLIVFVTYNDIVKIIGG